MKKYYRQTAVKLALIIMLSGTACMFSSCGGKTMENSPVSEAENSEDKSENVSTEPIDIKDPYTAEGMEFSVKSGFYEAPFYLEISVPEGSTVYYTLDGSVPDKNSIKYSEPLLITDRTEDKAVLGSHTEIVPPVVNNYYRVPVVQKKEKATVVRTMTVDKNGTQSKTVTNTYFVGSALGHEKYKGLKIVSLVTPEENLFDYEKGIYVMGKVYDDWKNSTDYDPEKEEWEVPANYKQKGREWERPASIQFFENGKLTYDPLRMRELGRLMASVGLNVLCINNVNVHFPAQLLLEDWLIRRRVSMSISEKTTVHPNFSMISFQAV